MWAAEAAKGANVGWFLLGDGVVAVDSGGDAATAKDILKQIAETTGNKPVRAPHPDACPRRPQRRRARLRRRGRPHPLPGDVAGQMLAFVTQPTNDPNDPLAGKAGIRPVVESISERSIMVDGIHNAQIYFLGAAHSAGDLVVYLSGDKILFSGDLALERPPALHAVARRGSGGLGAQPPVAVAACRSTSSFRATATSVRRRASQDSLAYVSRVNALAKKFVDSGTRDDMLDAMIRAPENAIPNVPLTDAHIANVKAVGQGRPGQGRPQDDDARGRAGPATPRAPLPATTPAK